MTMLLIKTLPHRRWNQQISLTRTACVGLFLSVLSIMALHAGHAQDVEYSFPASMTCPAGFEPETDLDGDCVDDNLEISGYTFQDALLPCTPSGDDPTCFVTDPTSWSTDGDPYSDFQEVTGQNMDSRVEAPYNNPLVAAAPRIEVVLLGYTLTMKGMVTDSRGRSISSGSEQSWNVESTVGVSYTTSASVSLTDVGVSTETTVSASVTAGYTSTQTRGEEFNWENAVSMEADAAASLTLAIAGRNSGSATAVDVLPTFNLFLGDEPLGTMTPSQAFPGSLTPGDQSPDTLFVSTIGDTEREITLSIAQLRRLHQGTPLKLSVTNIEARVSRWSPETSQWVCDPCLWGEFQDQIEARTLRVLVDFGYSGEREEDVPREYAGNPFEYRVYTGSPSRSSGNTLGDVLTFSGFELQRSRTGTAIEGRNYPGSWYITSGPERNSRDSSFFDYWEAADRPQDVLDMVMPRGAAVLMASPDPDDPGPIVEKGLLTRSMRGVTVSAIAKGSIPVEGAEAHLFFADGRGEVVPMERIEGTNVYASPDSLLMPIALENSFVEVWDVLQNKRQVSLTPSLPVSRDCQNIPQNYYQKPFFDDSEEGTRDGLVTVFIDGDLSKPATGYCVNEGQLIDFWYPQVNAMGLRDVEGVAVLDRSRRVAVGEGAILYSDNAGQTWTEWPLNADERVTYRGVAFREGTEVGIAVGDNGVFMRTEDGGLTWEKADVQAGNGPYTDVDYAGGDTWYAVGHSRVRRSDDNGRTWVAQAVIEVDTNGNEVDRGATNRLFRSLTEVTFLSEAYGVIGDWRMSDGVGRVYVTQDSGATWMNTIDYTGLTDLEYAGDGVWFLVGNNKIFRHENINQRSVGEERHSAASNWVIRALSFPTPEYGFAQVENGVVLRSDDNGENWSTLYGGYPTPTHPGTNFMRDIDMLDPLIGASVGTDGVIGATDSGGGSPINLSSTSTEDQDGARGGEVELPSQIELSQNYPNPFNPVTTISYRLSEQTAVQLEVFDVIGRRVALLVDEPQAAGAYRVRFDASTLTSGLYFYRLRTKQHAETKRMVLLR